MNKKIFLSTAIILSLGLGKIVAQCSATFMPVAVNAFTRQFNYVYSIQQDSNTTFHWNFGDGDTANTQNAMHTFTDTGAFQVCLTVKYVDADCQADTCLSVRVDTSCTAHFTYTYQPWLSQPEQDIYFFTDSSTGEDSSTIYNWDFGVGDFSSLQNIAFTYEPDDSGLEQVCLTIHNNDNGCTSQYCKTIDVDNLCIGATYSYVLDGNTGTFKASVCGQWDSISWNFGDGTTSNQGDSVVHTYSAAIDSYYVCMQVFITSECGYFYPCKSIECKEIQINPTGIPAITAANERLLVYPNPAGDHINVSTSLIQFPAEFRITDLAGKILMKKFLESTAQQIDVRNLATGIYFFQMSDASQENAITRFIKQ